MWHVTNSGNGEPGTGVWDLAYSGNPLENSKWRTKLKTRCCVLGLFSGYLIWDAHIWVASCKVLSSNFIKKFVWSVVLNVEIQRVSDCYPLPNITSGDEDGIFRKL